MKPCVHAPRRSVCSCSHATSAQGTRARHFPALPCPPPVAVLACLPFALRPLKACPCASATWPAYRPCHSRLPSNARSHLSRSRPLALKPKRARSHRLPSRSMLLAALSLSALRCPLALCASLLSRPLALTLSRSHALSLSFTLPPFRSLTLSLSCSWAISTSRPHAFAALRSSPRLVLAPLLTHILALCRAPSPLAPCALSRSRALSLSRSPRRALSPRSTISTPSPGSARALWRRDGVGEGV
eukprot:1356890-Pleurochrysis_carterae.AAC.1